MSCLFPAMWCIGKHLVTLNRYIWWCYLLKSYTRYLSWKNNGHNLLTLSCVSPGKGYRPPYLRTHGPSRRQSLLSLRSDSFVMYAVQFGKKTCVIPLVINSIFCFLFKYIKTTYFWLTRWAGIDDVGIDCNRVSSSDLRRSCQQALDRRLW